MKPRSSSCLSCHLPAFLGLALILLPALLTVGCSGQPDDSNAFWMKGEILYRGSRPYFLRAVEVDRVGDPELGILSKAEALNQSCKVGANSVMVPLPRPECVTGSPISLWLSEMAGLVEETTKRSMGLILQVDCACGAPPEDLAQYLADAFGDNRSILIWLSGAKASEIARSLKGKGSQNVLLGESDGFDLVVSPNGDTVPNSRTVSSDPPGSLQADSHIMISLRQTVMGQLEAQYGARPQIYSGPADNDGFLPLFNGTSLDGWRATGDPSGWAVEDGAIVSKHSGGGRLTTLARFSDFVLRLEWKIAEGRNSGLFIRCPAAGRESRIGMELQLFGDYGKPAHRNGTGSVYDVAAPIRNSSRPPGEWNQMEVECRGPRLRVDLNGATIQDLNLEDYPELKVRLRDGFVALQDHGDPVAFRSIWIKPLTPPSDPASASESESD